MTVPFQTLSKTAPYLFGRLLFLIILSAQVSAGSIPVIASGNRVDLDDHTEIGRYVLFDFYADWCGPCRSLSPFLERIADEHESQLSVKKIDVVNWDSQVTNQYRISSIPHLKLFDQEGILISEGSSRKVLRRLGKELGTSWPEIGSGGGIPWRGLGWLGIIAGFLLLAMAMTTSGKKRAERERAAAVEQRYIRHANNPKVAALWFVEAGDQLDGPYSVEDLRSLRVSGYLDRNTRVRKKIDTESIPLHVLLEG